MAYLYPKTSAIMLHIRIFIHFCNAKKKTNVNSLFRIFRLKKGIFREKKKDRNKKIPDLR